MDVQDLHKCKSDKYVSECSSNMDCEDKLSQVCPMIALIQCKVL